MNFDIFEKTGSSCKCKLEKIMLTQGKTKPQKKKKKKKKNNN